MRGASEESLLRQADECPDGGAGRRRNDRGGLAKRLSGLINQGAFWEVEPGKLTKLSSMLLDSCAKEWCKAMQNFGEGDPAVRVTGAWQSP